MGDKVHNSNGETTRKASDTDDLLKECVLVHQPKSGTRSDEADGKGVKLPVVQQKGRFKVTSEDTNLDKAVSSPVMSKSHSMQVIAQHQGVTVTPSLPSTEVAVTQNGNSFYSNLLSMLQINFTERDIILNLMKQISAGDISGIHDGRSTPLPKNLTEKFLLDAAEDRENDLLRQVTELQRRLIHTQEELKNFEIENLQVNVSELIRWDYFSSG